MLWQSLRAPRAVSVGELGAGPMHVIWGELERLQGECAAPVDWPVKELDPASILDLGRS